MYTYGVENQATEYKAAMKKGKGSLNKHDGALGEAI